MQSFEEKKLFLERAKEVVQFEKYAPIKDAVRADVTEKLIANMLEKSNLPISEAAPANNIGSGNIKYRDTILIDMARRSTPSLIAFDVAGVQPLAGPTGLIFSLYSRYKTQTGNEALFGEANTEFTGQSSGYYSDPYSANVTWSGDFSNVTANAIDYGTAMKTYGAEMLGGDTTNNFNEMGFEIKQHTVTAKSRAVKAHWTDELQQDLQATHGQSAKDILSEIMSQEISSEINRELIRTLYATAKIGAQGVTGTAGVYNMDVDSDGRWFVEKVKGLRFQIEREANEIFKQTRRGRGNFIICSPDVASALQAAGYLSSPDLGDNLNIDPAQSTFVGTLGTNIKVYIDPYFMVNSTTNWEYCMVGYKGPNEMDAGVYYCPYIPLQLKETTGEDDFQPRMMFKTRYGMTANPYVNSTGLLNYSENIYYRRFAISNLTGSYDAS